MSQLSWFYRPLVRYFLAGAFAVLPLVITAGVVIWVAGFLGRILGPDTFLGGVLARIGLTLTTDSAGGYVVGWVLVLGSILLLGVLVELGAKRFVQGRLDALASHVPLLGGVYGTARQLVGMMDKRQDTELQGMSVVFCRFGNSGAAWCLALLPTPKLMRIGGVDCHAVIIPTAPVPIGGGLVFVPASAVEPANITVDALMSIYVSMGVTGPQFLPPGAEMG